MATTRHKRLIKNFEAAAAKRRTILDKFADYLTSVFGSFNFLIFNCVFFIIWIVLNSGAISGFTPFDPFPFILLTMSVSLEAIMLSIIVLMSQNRQSLTTSLREEFHMNVNLIAEREITMVLKLVHEIAKKHGVKMENDELKKMLKELDQSYIEHKLQEELSPPKQHNLGEVITKIEEKIKETI